MRIPERLVCCALAAIMLSSTGWARIGDTPQESIRRYGQPLQTFPRDGVLDFGYKWLLSEYSATGAKTRNCVFVVFASFVDGTMELITIGKRKADPDFIPFTPNEVQALLNKFLGPGFLSLSTDELSWWRSRDQNIRAFVSNEGPGPMLYFLSNKYMKAPKAYEQRGGSEKPIKRQQQREESIKRQQQQQKDDELDIFIKKILQS